MNSDLGFTHCPALEMLNKKSQLKLGWQALSFSQLRGLQGPLVFQEDDAPLNRDQVGPVALRCIPISLLL